MQKFVPNFKEWQRLFENESTDDLDTRLEDMRRLADLGMIDKRELRNFLKREGAPALIKYDPALTEITRLPEYRELQERGLDIVSSRTQLMNGSIIFGRPGYRPYDGYAIGLFPDIQKIRRMKPKGIPLGVRARKYGSMDFTIKDLSVDPENFYRVAMRWVLDHIDLDDPFFPVKNKTRKGYFDQES